MPREKITAATCVKCGLCCCALTDQNAFCDVTPTDAKRLGKRFVRLHVLHPSVMDQLTSAFDGRPVPWGAIETKWKEQEAGPLKGVSVNACVALKGTVMQQVKCSVYAKRPDTCRTAVIPGDESCRWLRKQCRDAAKAS